MLIMFCSVCWSSFYRCHSWLPRVHPIAALAVFLFFLASLVYALSAFPFSHDAPIKVFFQTDRRFWRSGGSAGLLHATPVNGLRHPQNAPKCTCPHMELLIADRVPACEPFANRSRWCAHLSAQPRCPRFPVFLQECC